MGYSSTQPLLKGPRIPQRAAAPYQQSAEWRLLGTDAPTYVSTALPDTRRSRVYHKAMPSPWRFFFPAPWTLKWTCISQSLRKQGWRESREGCSECSGPSCQLEVTWHRPCPTETRLSFVKSTTDPPAFSAGRKGATGPSR